MSTVKLVSQYDVLFKHHTKSIDSLFSPSSRSSCKKSTTPLIVSFPARHSGKTVQRRQDTENQAAFREELDKIICLYISNEFSNDWLPNKIKSDKNLEEL